MQQIDDPRQLAARSGRERLGVFTDDVRTPGVGRVRIRLRLRCLLLLLLLPLLLLLLLGEVMSHCTACHGTDDSMMAGDVPRDGAYRGALQAATRLRIMRTQK